MTNIGMIAAYLTPPSGWTRVKKERVILGSVTAVVSSLAIHTFVTGTLPGPVLSCAAPLVLSVLLPVTAVPFVITSVSALAYSAGLPVTGAVVGCLSSTLLLQKLCFLIDYENPFELEQARSGALKTSLPKSVEKHGWNNLLKHRVLSPEAFGLKYCAYVDTVPFRELLSFYKVASKACEGTVFTVLPPSDWAQKFADETKGWGLNQIIDVFALEDLSGLVTQTEIDELYRSNAETLSFKDLLSWYQKAVSSCRGSPFTIPAPVEWKQKFIDETKDLTLTQILDSYPLKYLGECLAQEDFEKMFRVHVDTCGQFSDISRWHNKVSREAVGSPFKVPSLSEWKDRFFVETQGWTCHQIVEVFHVPSLLGCVSEKQYEILVQAREKLTEKNTTLRKLEDNLQKAKEAHRAQRDAMLRLAENRKTQYVTESLLTNNGKTVTRSSIQVVTSTDSRSQWMAQDAYHKFVRAAEGTFEENKRLVKRAYEADVVKLTALYNAAGHVETSA